MERQFNACQTPRSTYLSIFNSFRVIRCLSQCVSPKIAFLPHFCFPLGRPWGNHAKCCIDGKRIRCLQIVSQHVPMYLQQFPRLSNRKCKKTPFSRTAAHIFVSPGCMDGKRTRCLQIVSLHVPIYLLPFLRYSDIFVKKSSFYHTPLHSTPPLGGFPSEYRHPPLGWKN